MVTLPIAPSVTVLALTLLHPQIPQAQTAQVTTQLQLPTRLLLTVHQLTQQHRIVPLQIKLQTAVPLGPLQILQLTQAGVTQHPVILQQTLPLVTLLAIRLQVTQLVVIQLLVIVQHRAIRRILLRIQRQVTRRQQIRPLIAPQLLKTLRIQPSQILQLQILQIQIQLRIVRQIRQLLPIVLPLVTLQIPPALMHLHLLILQVRIKLHRLPPHLLSN